MQAEQAAAGKERKHHDHPNTHPLNQSSTKSLNHSPTKHSPTHLENLLILKTSPEQILDGLRFLLVRLSRLAVMVLIIDFQDGFLIVAVINLIETAVDEFLRHTFKLKVVPDLVASPGFDVEFPADITSSEAFFIQIILAHQVEENFFLRFRNQQEIPHLLLHFLVTTVLIAAVSGHFLFDFEESVGFVGQG